MKSLIGCIPIILVLAATAQGQTPTVRAEDGTIFPAPPALSAVTAAESELSGQVFISTNGGESVKLGGVDVSIYSKKDFDEQLAWANRYPDMHTKAVFADGTLESALLALSLRAHEWYLFRPAKYRTQTDADGKFVLRHCVSIPFVVVACAERDVGGDTEYFKWAVSSDELIGPGRLLLTNGNLWKRPASMQ